MIIESKSRNNNHATASSNANNNSNIYIQNQSKVSSRKSVRSQEKAPAKIKIHKSSFLAAADSSPSKSSRHQKSKKEASSSKRGEDASRDKVIFRKSNSFGEFQVQNLNKSNFVDSDVV